MQLSQQSVAALQPFTFSDTSQLVSLRGSSAERVALYMLDDTPKPVCLHLRLHRSETDCFCCIICSIGGTSWITVIAELAKVQVQIDTTRTTFDGGYSWNTSAMRLALSKLHAECTHCGGRPWAQNWRHVCPLHHLNLGTNSQDPRRHCHPRRLNRWASHS